MTLGYISQLNLKIYYINVEAEKIDNSIFKIFEMVLISLEIENKLRKT